MASDGVPIAAWFIRHPNPSGILLLLHGFGACKADLLDVAKAFHVQGPYHLLLMDFRAHGASGGRTITLGSREILDIEAALKHLSGEAALRGLPIGCYGVSMGGSVGLLAAARLSQIRAVVTDSAYADPAKAIARAQRLRYHLTRFPFGQMVIWATELRLGSRLRSLSPVRVIQKIAPRGVQIIHGLGDIGILPQEAEALFHAARQPKELWLVPEAEHATAFYRQRQEYPRRVLRFFQDALLRTA